MFEHAGADAVLDIAPGANLQHHVVDALQMQQMRQQEPCGARADDADRRSHGVPLTFAHIMMLHKHFGKVRERNAR
jgi:hypothetical protein